MTHETTMVILAAVASAMAAGFLSATAARSARCIAAPCSADERVARRLATRHANGQISTHDYERVLAVIRT